MSNRNHASGILSVQAANVVRQEGVLKIPRAVACVSATPIASLGRHVAEGPAIFKDSPYGLFIRSTFLPGILSNLPPTNLETTTVLGPAIAKNTRLVKMDIAWTKVEAGEGFLGAEVGSWE